MWQMQSRRTETRKDCWCLSSTPFKLRYQVSLECTVFLNLALHMGHIPYFSLPHAEIVGTKCLVPLGWDISLSLYLYISLYTHINTCSWRGTSNPSFLSKLELGHDTMSSSARNLSLLIEKYTLLHITPLNTCFKYVLYKLSIYFVLCIYIKIQWSVHHIHVGRNFIHFFQHPCKLDMAMYIL